MPDAKLTLVIDGKPVDAVLRLTEQQLKKLGLTSEQTGQQMGAAFARGAGVAEDAMQDAVKAISQLQAGTLQSIRQVDEAIAHLERAKAEATTEAGRGLFGGMIDQARVVRKGFVDVSDAADGMAAAQQRARFAGQTLGYTLNDAQQFAVSFQQGVIAISNNLPILAEQLSDVARESGSGRAAMKAMGGAMMGPAGILTLVSLGVTVFGAFSAAQARSRQETEKQTKALQDQEDQLRDNIRSLREMSGAAIAARQSQLAFEQQSIREDAERNRERLDQLRELKETWDAIQRGDIVRGGADAEAFFERLERATEGRDALLAAPDGGALGTGLFSNWGEAIESALADARVEATRLSAAFVDSNAEIAATNAALRRDLDAEIAALKAQEEQIIRNNELTAEQRQAELRVVREQLALKEKERDLRAGPDAKDLRAAEKAEEAAAARRLERMRLEAEQLQDTTERAVALVRYRFEVERQELREKFAGDEAYAAFLEEQIARLGRLERAAIAAATAPKVTDRMRPTADLEPVDLDLGDPLDVVETIGVVEMRLKDLRQQYKDAGDQADRDFIRKQIDGWEKILEAMEGGRTALMDWQEGLDLVQQGFTLLIDAAMQAEDARMAAIERRHAAEMAALDEEMAAEANRGKVLTEEEARREALMQKRRALEAKHDEEMRRERQRQAEAERTRALFEIAINTAVAVTKVWGQTGIFGVAAQWPVLAMGAAQAALVASQPVPKFARGVDRFRGGMALVGEEGPELVTLGAGSNVLTNRNTEMLLGLMASASRATPRRSAGGITKADLTDAFSQALAGTQLRASGRDLALVQAREDNLVRKAGLR